MAARLSLVDTILAIHQAFEGDVIDHDFGGALALAYYAEPRATNDVDVKVFIPGVPARSSAQVAVRPEPYANRSGRA